MLLLPRGITTVKLANELAMKKPVELRQSAIVANAALGLLAFMFYFFDFGFHYIYIHYIFSNINHSLMNIFLICCLLDFSICGKM